MRIKILVPLFLLIFFPAVFSYAPGVNAHTDDKVEEELEIDETKIEEELENEEATDSAKQETIEYTLVYPGILPDHPLYFLKVLRDKVTKFLINDDQKKAEFNLLNADKRVYAGSLLVEKGKDELSYETISKSNNYLHESIFAISKAKSEGKDVDGFLRRLDLSTRKHIEVLNDVRSRIDSKYQKDIDGELERLIDMEDSVSNLMTKE